MKSKYLRISVTNRCNISCYYCHNEGQAKNYNRFELSANDIIFFSKIALDAGFQKIKLTGGEPTLREDLGEIIFELNNLKFQDLSIITNGTTLNALAGELWNSGLRRLNISLQTLDRTVFLNNISNNLNYLKKIINGIDTAIKVGFVNAKLNFVYHGEQSNSDLEQILDFAEERNLIVVVLPILLINPKDHDSLVSLENLSSIFSKESILNEELIEDDEGIQKKLFVLKKNKQVLLRINELSQLTPYGECKQCLAKADCREGIFPIRLLSDGNILPCLAKGKALINIREQIINRRHNEINSILTELTK